MAERMTLEQKLEAAFESDTPIGFQWAYEWAHKIPGLPLSELQCDLRDWGLYFGVAYGIARSEDPYEPNGRVAARAYDAAAAFLARQIGIEKPRASRWRFWRH
jgi:hypothetical protein